MRTIGNNHEWLKVALGAGVAVMIGAGTSQAQPPALGPLDRGSPIATLGQTPTQFRGDDAGTPDVAGGPFGGQFFCPVSGKKLGLDQPALAVQTSIGAKQPGPIARLLGKKPTPGAVIYVSCPACAAQLLLGPEKYLSIVKSDMMTFSPFYNFDTAPPQRPSPTWGGPLTTAALK